ncbi:MAG: MalY/PatB family protein, partial [Bacillota bacterium]
GCHILNNKLVLKNNKYEINFEDFEKKAKKPNTTMFILCSPHNPVSRVWTKEELTKLANICIENDVLIVSDEIHNDLVYSDYNHHMLSSLNKKFEKHTITCTAASKTFNIAGFKSSNIIIPNKSLRDKYKKTLKRHSIGLQNPLSISAVTAAYENGEKWLEELLKYLEENAKYIEKFLNENLKKAKLIKPQATYLGWIDLREYEKDGKKLESLFNTKGGVAMDGGTWFGESGNGFMRINYACPKSVLKEGLNRIKDIIIEYDK